ncbi:MAG: hypothetical protein HFG71_15780 [Hungatella sp.]|jgi:hypothetical protein|nr:hypothetical protein [Hungatella sp.]
MINFKKLRLSYPKNIKITCISSVIFAILAHLFVLTNVVHNHDSLAELPKGYGTGITSGRWMLAILGKIAGKFWGNYNLPFYNNILSIFILVIAACFVVLIFNIQRPIFCALIGGILITTPPNYKYVLLRIHCSILCHSNYVFGYSGLANRQI